MSTSPFVLFVCLHGSAKSVIASQCFRRLAAKRGIAADTDSAGTEPAERSLASFGDFAVTASMSERFGREP